MANEQTRTDEEVTQALGEVMNQLRFVHLRDGIQALDSNRWTSPEVIDQVKPHNEFVQTVEQETGIRMQPTELTGGGQILQPMNFLGEDPIANIEKIKEAGTDLDIMSLYRGRQGYGFEPISDEMQNVQITESVKAGVSTIQVFDMMNDLDNVKVGIAVSVAIREEQKSVGEEQPLKVNGMISYMSPPDDGREAAMTNKDYAQYAKEMKDLGVDQITIKDYAGQLTSPEQGEALVKAIRQEIGDDIQLNVHSHNHKPDIMQAMLNAGADTVDVGIGKLAKGSAHTDAKEMIALKMEEKGFTPEDYKDHAIMKAYDKAEQRVNEASEKHEPYRKEINDELQEKIIKSRLAGGAVGAVWSKIDTDGMYEIMQSLHWKDLEQSKIPSKEEYFEATLEAIGKLWEKSGQINSVTPGSEILSKQALVLAAHEIAGKELKPDAYNQDFKNVIMGRYGDNRGMDKGLGDTDLRDQFLAEDRERTRQSLAAGTEERKAQIETIKTAAGTEENLSTPDKVIISNLNQHIESRENSIERAGKTGALEKPTAGMKEARQAVQEIEKETGIKIEDKHRAAVLVGLGGKESASNVIQYQKTGIAPERSSITPERTKAVESTLAPSVADLATTMVKLAITEDRIKGAKDFLQETEASEVAKVEEDKRSAAAKERYTIALARQEKAALKESNWIDSERKGVTTQREPKWVEREAPIEKPSKEEAQKPHRSTPTQNLELMETLREKIGDTLEKNSDALEAALVAKGYSNDKNVVPSKNLDKALEKAEGLVSAKAQKLHDTISEKIESSMQIWPEIIAAKKEVFPEMNKARA